MKLETELKPDEVIAILRREIDQMPSLFRCLVTLNAHRYRGTSIVCGEVRGNEFELRNRRDPYLSMKAIGKVCGAHNGTEIELRFQKTALYNIFQIFHTDDKEVILRFLNDNLQVKNTAKTDDANGF